LTSASQAFSTNITSASPTRGRGGLATPATACSRSVRKPGRLLNIVARSLGSPNILKLGTSFGYSGLRLADAARATGGRMTTVEIAPHKSVHAREMATKAGLATTSISASATRSR